MKVADAISIENVNVPDDIIKPIRERKSNIELCRIICMLLIIAHHSVIHGSAIGMNNCLNKYIAFFLVPGGKLCFVTFIAISTWFLVDKQFKLERFFKTWLQVLFYSILFSVVAVALGTTFTWRNWFSIFFPITGNSHGFAATYLAFYLLTPFLGMITQKIEKRQLACLVVFLFYFQVVSKILGKINGYELPILSSEVTLFILFYFISLWAKRYPVHITNNKMNMFGIFFGVWVSVFGIWCLSITNFAKTNIFHLLINLASDESSLLYIVGGYALFFFFKNIEIPTNKVINYVAHGAFGVLLFHDHNFFRYQLWKHILKAPDWYYQDGFILWVIVCVISIYCFGLFIDTIRGYFEKIIFKSIKIKSVISHIENYLSTKK